MSIGTPAQLAGSNQMTPQKNSARHVTSLSASGSSTRCDRAFSHRVSQKLPTSGKTRYFPVAKRTLLYDAWITEQPFRLNMVTKSCRTLSMYWWTFRSNAKSKSKEVGDASQL